MSACERASGRMRACEGRVSSCERAHANESVWEGGRKRVGERAIEKEHECDEVKVREKVRAREREGERERTRARARE